MIVQTDHFIKCTCCEAKGSEVYMQKIPWASATWVKWGEKIEAVIAQFKIDHTNCECEEVKK